MTLFSRFPGLSATCSKVLLPATALACISAFSPSTATAQVIYDVCGDYGFGSNPAGLNLAWSYHYGSTALGQTSTLLPYIPTYMPAPGSPGGYVRSVFGVGHTPYVTKVLAPVPGWDTGGPETVVMHSWDPFNSGSPIADATIAWTAPMAGPVDLYLDAWLVRDMMPVRRVNIGLYRVQTSGVVTPLFNGSLASYDPYSSTTPLRPSPQPTLVPMNAGDQIQLVAEHPGGFYIGEGDIVAVRFQVHHYAGPPASTTSLPPCPGAGPTLTFDPPIFGGSATLDLRAGFGAAGAPFLLLFAPPPATPTPWGPFPLCLDANAPTTAPFSFALDSNGSWSWTWGPIFDPAFVGASFVMQAVVFPAGFRSGMPSNALITNVGWF